MEGYRRIGISYLVQCNFIVMIALLNINNNDYIKIEIRINSGDVLF